MKFSERLGYKPVKDQLQVESIDNELRNSLWSVFLNSFFNDLTDSFIDDHMLSKYCNALWFDFFKLPIDTAPLFSDRSVHKPELQKYLRKYYFDSKIWYEPFDFLEFTAKYAGHYFIENVNIILEREKSAYRFVNGQITPLTSSTEILEIEEALTSNDIYKSVNVHLSTALGLLADRQTPDYRNSIKESISAVESMCKIFMGDNKATLGEVLNQIEKRGLLHPALKKAFSSLYGYTSDEGGIRHALLEGDRQIDFYEAKFMLVICSSFINYLKSKNM